MAILEGKDGPRSPIDGSAAALEFLAPAAVGAVPALRQALGYRHQWVRVHAARALWKITRNPDEALPVLLEELRCRPAGLLAADCLGDMGHLARAAVPALRRVLESKTRLVRIGTEADWIDEDEGFCEAARRALARIEADPVPAP